MNFNYTIFLTALLFLLKIYSVTCWTSNKCLISEISKITHHINDPIPCRLYPNATIIASCDKIMDFNYDFLNVPHNINVLCFKGNAETIGKNTFSKFQELLALEISLPINTIIQGAFSGLSKLEHLSITLAKERPNIVTFPKDIFFNLTSLKTLTLCGLLLPENTQIMMPLGIKLDLLSMTFSLLSDIFYVFKVFQGIHSIKILNLSHNNINYVTNTHFLANLISQQQKVAFPNITLLNLSHNNVSKVFPGSFHRMYFTSLIMDHNCFNWEDLLMSGITNLNNLSLKYSCEQKHNMSYLIGSLCSKFALVSLSLAKNNILSIEHQALKKCKSLEYLYLNSNGLKYLDTSFLSQLPNFKNLNLSDNSLPLNLCPNTMNATYNVEIISFAKNNVTHIKRIHFFCTPHLKTLILASNKIRKIELSAFLDLRVLEMLDLSKTKLKYLSGFNSFNLPFLNTLNLQNVNINLYPLESFKGLPNLEVFRISTIKVFPQIWLLPTLKKLSVKSDTIDIFIQGYNNYSLQKLSLEGQYIYFHSMNITNLLTVKKIKIYNNKEVNFVNSDNTFSRFFPYLEKCIFQPRKSQSVVNMSNLLQLNYLNVHIQIPSAGNANLNPENLFQNLPRLKVLKLLNSGIRYFTAAFFKEKTSLKLLVLQGNFIISLTSDIQGYILNLRYLYFYDVVFQCNCANSWLINWSKTTKKTFVFGLDNVSCIQLHKDYPLVAYTDHHCSTEIEFVLFVMTSVFVVLFMFFILMYNNHRALLLHLMYILGAWLRKIKGRKKEHVKYCYDAFVSYSSLDHGWVAENLIPNLEETGPPFLNLCLHNRDFELGKDIVDNIMDSIYKSRKTICLISRNYLSSSWCSLEMRIATYRLLAERDDVLILVFLERISRYQLSSYHRLAKIVKKKTYIDWPEENDKQLEFWEKLRHTIQDARMENQDMDI